VDFLGKITSPSDLRALPKEALRAVADEVRAELMKVVSEKGGHLASNLGSVELSVALHYVFDTPRDKLVWDVGHQSYPHKILTGRREAFPTIRQGGGISGFTCRSESEYDPFGAGHASTSISAALGIAEGMKHSGFPHVAIAVIGDGSMTGGLAFEALNNAGHIPARNLIVVLNDNDMSIDPNVGALNSFVNHALTHPGYNRVRKEIRSILGSLGDLGVPLTGIAAKLRTSAKNLFTPGMLFECFGFRYFGPIDGHNLDQLLETFEFIQKEGPGGGPYLVHALTVKGKGYSRAEQLPLQYHGVTPFKVDVGLQKVEKKKQNYQDIFADTLIRIAKQDPRVVAITAAMPSGTGLNKFQKEFPTRCYDVGIAEAHAVAFAAGLATEGFRPVAGIYSTFLQRAYDQIIHDVALQNLPVIFAMDRGGLVGADGATHQGAFDLSYLRAVPGMVIMAPKDENELQHMLYTSVLHTSGPIAFRYPRGEVVGVAMDSELKVIPIGKGEVVNGGGHASGEVALVGVGLGVQLLAEAQKLLAAEGVISTLVNARFIKPLDTAMLAALAESSCLVVTVEENSLCGGFGSAVAELFSDRGIATPLLRLGLPDSFIDHGTPAEQRAAAGIDPKSLALSILEKLRSAEVKTPPFVHRALEPSVPSAQYPQ
jgi:1-deoxy-D-xylulose-5-phosphate synthase